MLPTILDLMGNKKHFYIIIKNHGEFSAQKLAKMGNTLKKQFVIYANSNFNTIVIQFLILM